MTRLMQASGGNQPPRFGAIQGDVLEQLLWQWLRHPHLARATLISFTVDPDLELTDRMGGRSAETVGLLNQVERVAVDAEITLVTSSPASWPPGPIARLRYARLQGLASAGARVMFHKTLHAKVFLFEIPGRTCWVVGSSNLSHGGLRVNEEVNLRGYHPLDFDAVSGAAQRLVAEAWPL
jgi:phosphatidylserine/phosphatidylglycerophosphate/cardiolipin synthase-like enzyme